MNKSLIRQLQKNVRKILEILKNQGIDVSKYNALADELEEKKKRQNERAQVNYRNYKQSATAFLNDFAYSDLRMQARQKETNDIQALKDCITVSNEQTEELQQIISVATSIKNGKTPNHKKSQPLQLKSLENRPSILETAKRRQEERRRQAKQEFIKYYSENWFIILLDAIKAKRI